MGYLFGWMHSTMGRQQGLCNLYPGSFTHYSWHYHCFFSLDIPIHSWILEEELETAPAKSQCQQFQSAGTHLLSESEESHWDIWNSYSI